MLLLWSPPEPGHNTSDVSYHQCPFCVACRVKAAVLDAPGPPSVLEYRSVPDPDLRAGGVIIEVEAIGLQGGDLGNRRHARPRGPHIVGYQASGTVRDIGEGVDGIAVGDRVVATMMSGSHAELVSVAARKVWVIPDGVSFEHAAVVPIEFGTASDALFEFGRLQAGETVLVHGGAGGVGMAALQLARLAGAIAIATASDDERLGRLADFGVHHVVNYRTEDVPDRVRALTDGNGADLVLDPVGGRTLESSIAALAYRGRISWIGNAQREPADVWPLMEKNGVLIPQFFALEQSRQPERTRTLVAGLLDRVAAGELRMAIDRTFPLAAAALAHEYAEQGHPFGRIVLVPGG